MKKTDLQLPQRDAVSLVMEGHVLEFIGSTGMPNQKGGFCLGIAAYEKSVTEQHQTRGKHIHRSQ